jgi:carboxypeptidase PM20D1
MRRAGIALALGLVVLAATVAGNALRARSRQIAVASVPPGAVDPGAVTRFAGALRLPTVSHQDPTQDDPAPFAALHRYLAATFPRVHATLRRETVGGRSLLFTWPGREPSLKPLLLLAHQDVVPVDPASESAWTHPPFAGDVADGFVWGRGAMDDKGALVGLLETVETLVADGFAPRRTIVLAFGHDEEVGGGEGAVALARVLRERGVAPALVLDEGLAVTEDAVPDVAAPVALVGIAEKGYVSVELAVVAQGGHSSTPPRETAVGILAGAVAALERHPMPAAIGGPARRLFEFVGPEMGVVDRTAVANLWLFGPLVVRRLATTPATDALLRTTTAPTMLEGSVKENVLPVRARAVVNFRIRPGDTVAGVLAHVRRVVGDARVQVAPYGPTRSEPSPEASVESAGFLALARTIREVFPGAIVAPSLVLGATDSRHYAVLGADVYRFLPFRLRLDDLKRVHGVDERLPVADYEEAVRFYGRLIRNLDAP